MRVPGSRAAGRSCTLACPYLGVAWIGLPDRGVPAAPIGWEASMSMRSGWVVMPFSPLMCDTHGRRAAHRVRGQSMALIGAPQGEEVLSAL